MRLSIKNLAIRPRAIFAKAASVISFPLRKVKKSQVIIRSPVFKKGETVLEYSLDAKLITVSPFRNSSR